MTQDLNKFEKTRILSARALELSQGDKPKVNMKEKALLTKDYIKVAQEELDTDKIELEVVKKQ